jgi:hypothetical protein
MASGKFLGQSAETWGLTLLAADSVPNFLAGMAPSLFTLQHMGGTSQEHQAEAKISMQRAYVVGGLLSLASGLGASLVSRSPLPLVATVTVFVILVVQYEHALDNPHSTSEEMFRG